MAVLEKLLKVSDWMKPVQGMAGGEHMVQEMAGGEQPVQEMDGGEQPVQEGGLG